MMCRRAVLFCLMLASVSCFAPSSGKLAPTMALRSSARFSSSCRMQSQNKGGGGEREYPKFEPDMNALNDRINKLKEREANLMYKLQDTVTDKLEPLQRDAKKLAGNVPNPKDMLPVTGLPKWALPLGAILFLSLLTSILQNQQTYNPAGLASGSL